ncbi:Spy/CpxP family protein refolding chaperone [Acidiphilium sp. AL]|uniref:Spy/CpxP family protein refolding chaperone n=1 Tax=Acidiphilium sp. AL TaxID=2871704 RepID=UPI0021CB720C|nr:Spy/CpxP family protein refolding chaperone [Acidiphilium sp. AL]MCU4160686.1 Spy/CpxP family protein refolding chaperone [Acidiphilium sp. AL]
MMPRFISATVLSAGLLIAGLSPAFAQSTQSTAPAASSAATTSPASEIKAHINKLRTELKITSAQRSQWDALASVMRQNATQMETLYKQRSRNAETMTAVEILKSYREFTRAHLAALNKLIPAFTKLYGVLSHTQKKTADELFENRVAVASGARKTQ